MIFAAQTITRSDRGAGLDNSLRSSGPGLVREIVEYRVAGPMIPNRLMQYAALA